MSQENLTLARRAVEASLRRPEPDFETVDALVAADHVLVPVAASKLGEGDAVGARGYRDWLKSMDEATPWEGSLAGAVDVGPHTVLAVIATRHRGVSSGIDVEQRMWLVLEVRDGKLARTEAYFDSADALEAVGLRE